MSCKHSLYLDGITKSRKHYILRCRTCPQVTGFNRPQAKRLLTGEARRVRRKHKIRLYAYELAAEPTREENR